MGPNLGGKRTSHILVGEEMSEKYFPLLIFNKHMQLAVISQWYLHCFINATTEAQCPMEKYD